MTDRRDELPQDVRATYDAVARHYAETFADDLEDKVIDRALLDAFAEMVRRGGGGRVGDLGCGPGFESRYLAERGLDVIGVDLSPGMISEAQRRHAGRSGLEFVVGSLLALPLADAALSGAVAIYSVIHLEPGERDLAYREMARVVRAGGPLLICVHISAADFPPGSVRHLDQWWGESVALNGYFIADEEVAAGLAAAGFDVEVRLTRGPATPREFPSRRAYLVATRRA